MWKKRPKTMTTTTETKGEREDVDVKHVGIGSDDTDGTLVTYGTGFTLSGKFQAVAVRCEVTFPTVAARYKSTMKIAMDAAEGQLAQQLPHAQKLLARLIKMRETRGG